MNQLHNEFGTQGHFVNRGEDAFDERARARVFDPVERHRRWRATGSVVRIGSTTGDTRRRFSGHNRSDWSETGRGRSAGDRSFVALISIMEFPVLSEFINIRAPGETGVSPGLGPGIEADNLERLGVQWRAALHWKPWSRPSIPRDTSREYDGRRTPAHGGKNL